MPNATTSAPHAAVQPPTWKEVATRFRTDRECLASFFAMETAEILEGVKPGNLVNVVNRRQACGRNLYDLWLEHGASLLDDTGLSVKVLRNQPGSLLLFLYDDAALAALLDDRRVQAMLRRADYSAPSDAEGCLKELRRRTGSAGFPHEIGIFLGYPLKDVAAFMGWASIPFTCQGPWRIYGDPNPSLQIAELHRDCRCRMAFRMAVTADPSECLRRAS